MKPERLSSVRSLVLLAPAALLGFTLTVVIWAGMLSAFGNAFLVLFHSLFSLVTILALTLGAWLMLRRWHSLRILVASCTLAIAVLTWLAWDPGTEPSVPDAAPSNAKPIAAAPAIQAPRIPSMPVPLGNGTIGPDDTWTWRAFIVQHREEIRTLWESAGEVRDYVSLLNSSASLGVAWRLKLQGSMKVHAAYASLLAIEGQGDEALAVLQPMLTVARRLEPAVYSESDIWAVHSLRAWGTNTVRFVLHASAPSETALRALVSRLESKEDFGALSRRVAAGDARWLSEWFRDGPLNLRVTLWDRIWKPFFFNPRASVRLAAQWAERLAEVAGEGRGEGLRAHERALRREVEGFSFKNPIGRYYVPFFSKKLSAAWHFAWKADDQRRALLAEVQAKLAEAEKREAAATAKGAP